MLGAAAMANRASRVITARRATSVYPASDGLSIVGSVLEAVCGHKEADPYILWCGFVLRLIVYLDNGRRGT
jgi:hypothetical protein